LNALQLKRYITACALDASGAVVAEIRQLATTIDTVLDWLAALPAPLPIAMEATLYWEWLVTRLQEAGHTARVPDAYQVKLIWQARSKTDTIDARKLARTCHHELGVASRFIPTSWGVMRLRRSAEALLLPLLDDEGGVDVFGVVAPTRTPTRTRTPTPGRPKTGGAPDSTFGSDGVAGSRHSPGNANGPPPSHTRSCLPDVEALEDDFDWRSSLSI